MSVFEGFESRHDRNFEEGPSDIAGTTRIANSVLVTENTLDTHDKSDRKYCNEGQHPQCSIVSLDVLKDLELSEDDMMNSDTTSERLLYFHAIQAARVSGALPTNARPPSRIVLLYPTQICNCCPYLNSRVILRLIYRLTKHTIHSQHPLAQAGSYVP